MSDLDMKAQKVTGNRRKSKTYGENRVCAQEG